MFKNTALISVLTFFSRILGMVRDALIAMIFGTSFQSDAFFIAFRPFDLVRKLFSEGILGTSFVPVFSGILAEEGRQKAFETVFSVFCFLSLAGIFVTLMGMLWAPFFLKLVVPGLASEPYCLVLTLVLFKIMLPYFWLIMLTALGMGILHSFGNFGIPAVSPVVFNLVMILFAILVAPYIDPPVLALAFGVTVGGLFQMGIHIPALLKSGMFRYLSFRFINARAFTILKTLVPCMIGAASYQINILVASFFAAALDQGSVSILYFADRLVQFPLALFAVSAATVFLPELTRQAAAGQTDEVGQVFTTGVKLVLFITIPAMAGLMALHEHVVALLFGRGLFDAAAIAQTSQCLLWLVSGLWAFTCARLFVTLYFAVHNIRIPFLSGSLAIGLNLILCAVLIDPLGLQGLAIAVSGSSAAGFLFLLVYVPGAVRGNRIAILLSACRSVFLSGIMFFLVKFLSHWIPLWTANRTGFAAGTLGCIIAGIGFYWGGSFLISSPELKIIHKALKAGQG